MSENYLQHSDHFSRILISQENLKNNNENFVDQISSDQIKVDNQNKETEEPSNK